ncbi:iron uptake system protein EfeO [Nakamurella endophytica]|uniref:Lipoprotein n=1 Tax=Nakamurella endophytica TaxID=1748367 RepID=A0A917WLW4_9ACTN|nr:iron uptake system protein EfeO [Nakamurella endophytica]GGM15088.1 lipoprotein [Nakamurella endophytica]
MTRARLSRRATALGAAVLATAVLSTACGTSTGAGASSAATSAGSSAGSSAGGAAGSSAGAASSAAAGSGSRVTVTITDAQGCAVSPDTVPAGQVTFDLRNVDATGVTELELVAAQRILGERENLTPGFDSTFSVRVDGGAYQIYCPGAATERVPFTVTGKAAESTGDIAELLQQAAVEYAGYVDDQVSFLQVPVRQLADAVKAGDLAAARAAYARARPFYERIEPVAESFPDLDPAIDLRVGDVEAGTEWTGFHPIEQALFVKKTTKGLGPLADKLVADVKKLQTLTGQLSTATKADDGKGYAPFEIANGASGLLEEVLKSKITGEEEAYSRIDLLDFEANVEGSQQAFATLEPALNRIDPTLVPQITQRFQALTTVLDTYRDPKALGGWTPYQDLSSADKKKLTDALLAVQEPLSAIAGKITA